MTYTTNPSFLNGKSLQATKKVFWWTGEILPTTERYGWTYSHNNLSERENCELIERRLDNFNRARKSLAVFQSVEIVTPKRKQQLLEIETALMNTRWQYDIGRYSLEDPISGQVKNGFLFLGETGRGKTMLASLIVEGLQVLGARSRQVRLSDFMATWTRAKRGFLEEGPPEHVVFDAISFNSCEHHEPGKPDVAQYVRYDLANVLLLDDFGSGAAGGLSPASREAMEALISGIYDVDDVYLEERPILLVTTNLSWKEIRDFSPRIASRLAEMCHGFQLDGPDYRILKTKQVREY